MQQYVVGFVFTGNCHYVYLIRKARPEWQAGKLNGVGGKIEQGETPYLAMVREFEEETGVRIDNWKFVGTMGRAGQWQCVIFAHEATAEENGKLGDAVNQHFYDQIEEPLELRMSDNFYHGLGLNSQSPAHEAIDNVQLLVEACKYSLRKEQSMAYFHWAGDI